MSKSVSLIVSHNNRIQCLLDKIIPNMSGVKMRFQNCAILRFFINNHGYKINLVYPGELSSYETQRVSQQNPYYTTDDKSHQFKPGFVIFPNYDFPIFEYAGANDDFYGNLNLKKEDMKNKEFVFYVVRHGQGEHNQSYNLGIVKVSSTFGLKKDTRVTTSGESQAYNAGFHLYNVLDKYKENIHEWFASDLLRTRQTMTELIAGINNASKFKYTPKLLNIVILPCGSEINTVGSGKGDCDSASASNSILRKIARENYPHCTKNDIIDNEENNKSLKGCFKIESIPLFWDFYLLFYGNDMRSQNDTIYGTITSRRYRQNQMKQQCRNTNMISMAIFYINFYKNLYPYNNDSYGLRIMNQALTTYIKERINSPIYNDESLNSLWSNELAIGGKYKKKIYRRKTIKKKHKKIKTIKNNKK
jgi:hypothetical protein